MGKTKGGSKNINGRGLHILNPVKKEKVTVSLLANSTARIENLVRASLFLSTLIALGGTDIFLMADAPQDLVQVIIGDGLAGAQLIDEVPDKVSFTGSIATGKKIAKQPIVTTKEVLIFIIDFCRWGTYSGSSGWCCLGNAS